MADKKFTHHATCPVDHEQKEIELLYTETDGNKVFWRNKTLNEWCDKIDSCPKRRGEPLRCPLFLSSPRFLPG